MILVNKEEIIQKRDELRGELEDNIEQKNLENQKIGKIVYYKDFEIINSTQQYMRF